jgi:hypothetical protein
MRTTEIASSGSGSRWVVAALAAPPLVMAAATTLMVLLGLTGRHPFWDGGPSTLCEAVAMGDGAEALRQIRRGAAVNGRCAPVALTSRTHAPATPLEIATRGQRADLAALLTAEGARPDDAVWRAVVCQHEAQSAALRAALEPYAPVGTVVCSE